MLYKYDYSMGINPMRVISTGMIGVLSLAWVAVKNI